MTLLPITRHSILQAAGAVFAVFLCAAPLSLYAQQKAMTVEELEAYIEEQKAALEQVKANRDETEEKAAEVLQALAEQDARRSAVEEELEELCKEQEELKPGSYDDCKQNSES